MSTTTLKLPDRLKARIARLAEANGQSAHSFMVKALEHVVARAEHMHAFVREAVAADAAIEAGGETYRAEDVYAWLDRLAYNPKAGCPPSRK